MIIYFISCVLPVYHNVYLTRENIANFVVIIYMSRSNIHYLIIYLSRIFVRLFGINIVSNYVLLIMLSSSVILLLMCEDRRMGTGYS